MPAKPIAISLCHLLLLSAAIFAQDGESSGEYSIEPDRHYFCGDARGGEEYIEVFLVHLNRLNQMEEPEIAREIVDELTRVLGNNGMAGTVSIDGADYFAMAKQDGLAFRVEFGEIFEDFEQSTSYALRIDRDGETKFYDFTGIDGPVRPERLIFCRRQPSIENFEGNSAREVGPDSISVPDRDVHPVIRVKPQYPRQALLDGLEGYVDLEFTITSEGTVRDPVVIYSTSDVFERAAIRAILRWHFKPRVLDGVPVATLGKQRIEFAFKN